MSKGIVDNLELIKIEIQQGGGLLAVAFEVFQGFRKTVFELATID